MAKCMQCGGAKKTLKALPKKMKAGGSTDVNISKPSVPKKGTEGNTNQKYFIYGMPTTTTANAGIATMKKGGAMSKINRAVTPGCRGGKVKDANGNCVEVRKAKVGGSLKPVTGDKVGLSKLPTAVRNKMGYQQSGGTMKKAAGGPILDKLKAKLAERKVTKAIKKSVKSSGKIIK